MRDLSREISLLPGVPSSVGAFHARVRELERAGEQLQRTNAERERVTEALRVANAVLKNQLKEGEHFLMELAAKNKELTQQLDERAKETEAVRKEYRSLKQQLAEQQRDFCRRLAATKEERDKTVQVMADEGHGLQARIAKLEQENETLTVELARAEMELRSRSCGTTAHSSSSACSTNFSRGPSSGSSFEPHCAHAAAHSLQSQEAGFRVADSGATDRCPLTALRAANRERSEVELKEEKIKLLECEVGIKDRKFRLCHMENAILKKQLNALQSEATGRAQPAYSQSM